MFSKSLRWQLVVLYIPRKLITYHRIMFAIHSDNHSVQWFRSLLLILWRQVWRNMFILYSTRGANRMLGSCFSEKHKETTQPTRITSIHKCIEYNNKKQLACVWIWIGCHFCDCFWMFVSFYFCIAELQNSCESGWNSVLSRCDDWLCLAIAYSLTSVD